MRLAAAALAALLALPATAQDDRRPPLFVLSDDDSRVYLLGSVHVLPADALPLPDHVESAYADASVVAFELDLDAAQAGAVGMVAAATDDATIADVLSGAQRDTLYARLGTMGVPAGAFDQFEPWFVGMTYGVLALQNSGLPVEAGGVDAHYFGRAGADGKERVAFETVELQTAAFDDLSDAAQVEFLMQAVEASPDSSAAQFARLVALWASGDDDGLGTFMSDEMAQPEVFESLLVARNRAWVPQIESLLAREGETALVVVGAGHLVGRQSVVEMLREAGYTVDRL